MLYKLFDEVIKGADSVSLKRNNAVRFLRNSGHSRYAIMLREINNIEELDSFINYVQQVEESQEFIKKLSNEIRIIRNEMLSYKKVVSDFSDATDAACDIIDDLEL